MRAQYVINTERWDDPVLDWTMDVESGTDAAAGDAFTLGYAALERGDRDAVATQVARLQSAAQEGGSPAARVLALNLAAAVAAEDGAFARAEELLGQATGIEDSLPAAFGPPDIVKPSWELLGELLLARGRAAEAQTAFTNALALAPKRALSLRGLVAAATAAGDQPVAERARQDLEAIWHAADDAVRNTLAAR
jgi:cytochrome c-type biogenesis protein CcmH/NrfG